VFEAVVKRRATHGVVPLENSIGGTIHRNYDLLLEHELPITGEVELDVVHCLLALPGTSLPDIKVVYSHPQALAQCERYLKDLGVTVEAVYDTAGGAKLVAEQRRRDAAALASRRAADVFGLEVLQEAVQDFEFNITRFFVIGGSPPPDANKTTIVFALPSTPGSLFKAPERLRAARHQSEQAREPPDARPAVGVPLLRRHGCPARRLHRAPAR
jgi:prephenate dehydratase